MAGGPAADRTPVADAELAGLFAPFLAHASILIAVSGGPDSTALLHLAARWRALRQKGPVLVAATVDHGLRPEAVAEATAVAATASALGIAHRICLWMGTKPQRGVQAAARAARYALLTEVAREVGAGAIALAHTRDDQAETVLFRIARGSGLAGLAAMQADSARGDIRLLRPFLDLPKARLVATLEAAGLPFVRDPSNTDPRFARPRLRALAPQLAGEGLDARRLALLTRRMARADAALEAATTEAERRLGRVPAAEPGSFCLDRDGFVRLPEEIALRLLGRAVALVGTEGPVELAKLEALLAAVTDVPRSGGPGLRRTLAGALVTVRRHELHLCAAPPRGKNPPLAPNSNACGPGILGKRGPRS